MHKPVVGEILWEVHQNIKHITCHKVVVTKVGKKYFSVAPPEILRLTKEYHIENWKEKTDYTPSYHLYETEQEWLDEIETEKLQTRIQSYFNTYNRKIPLEILRTIDKLLPQGNN